MSENIKECKEITEIFTYQYNLENSTDYTWIEGESFQPREPADAMVKDTQTGKKLFLQLTKAIADREREIVRWKKAEKVIWELKNKLENNNLPAISVHLNFENQPKKKEEIEGLIFWLDMIITHKVNDAINLSYFTYDKSYDNQFIKEISGYISQLIIFPIRGQKNGKVVMAWGTSKEYPEPILDDEQRISLAIRKKSIADLSGHILIVDSGTMPISDYYLPTITANVPRTKADQIWVVENFTPPHKRAVRIV